MLNSPRCSKQNIWELFLTCFCHSPHSKSNILKFYFQNMFRIQPYPNTSTVATQVRVTLLSSLDYCNGVQSVLLFLNPCLHRLITILSNLTSYHCSCCFSPVALTFFLYLEHIRHTPASGLLHLLFLLLYRILLFISTAPCLTFFI